MNTNDYLLHWWGKGQDEVKQHLGLASYLWFETEAEREEMKRTLRKWGIPCMVEHNGHETHQLLVARLLFEYKRRLYPMEYVHGFVDDEYIENACNLWTEGNYSCDCNRSDFLSDVHDDFPIEDFEDGTWYGKCGELITLRTLAFCREECDNHNVEIGERAARPAPLPAPLVTVWFPIEFD